MHKTITFIYILLLFSCNTNRQNKQGLQIEKALTYMYETRSDNNGKVEFMQRKVMDTFEISVSKISESIYVYNWNLKVGSEWIFRDSINFSSKEIFTKTFDTSYSILRKESKSYFIDKRVVSLTGDKYHKYNIYKVLTTQDTSKVGWINFWTPEFGILLSREINFNKSHKNYKLIRTEILTNPQKCKEMHELCYSILCDIHDSTDFFSISNEEFYKAKSINTIHK